LFVSIVLRVLVSAETANLTGWAGWEEVYVLIGANNNSLPWVHENLVLRIGKAGYLNEAFIHDNFCIPDSVHGNAEFGATNGDRCCGTIDSVGIWFPTEMIDSYTNAAHQNFEQLPEGVGRVKVFQQNPRAWTNHDEAAVGQLYREPSAAPRVNLFSREKHIAALCGSGSLRVAG
jgi:hypothetical protein